MQTDNSKIYLEDYALTNFNDNHLPYLHNKEEKAKFFHSFIQ
jgi:hypothetical protein